MQKFYKTLVLAWFCFTSFPLFAQEIVISGVLMDEELGEPMVGASMYIKGTTTGVVVDVEGQYTITAKVGDIIVVSLVGYKTREFVVTEEGLALPNGKTILKIQDEYKRSTDYLHLLQDSTPKQGVGIFKPTTPSYTFTHPASNQVSPQIFRVKQRGNKLILRNVPYQFNKDKKLVVSFENQTAFSHANRLPDLQKTYAQGRPINGKNTWQGAETGEVFSWGAPIASLRYTGGAYAYDQNGALSEAGAGRQAKSYNPYRFLQTGVTHTSSIGIRKYYNHRSSEVSARYERQYTQGILPTAKQNAHSFNLFLKGKKRRWVRKGDFQYQIQESNLPELGNNWQQIFASVLRTPPTFDNANGLRTRQAIGKTNVYLLPDGSNRSHSPNEVFNPFHLVDASPDGSRRNILKGELHIENQKNQGFLSGKIGYTFQNNHTWQHTPFLPASGAQTWDRKEQVNNTYAHLRGHQTWNNWTINGEYKIDYQQNKLERTDAFSLLPTFQATQKTLSRAVHQPKILGKFYFSYFMDATFGNQAYLSNTSPKPYFFLPEATLRVDMRQLMDNWLDWYWSYDGFVSDIRLSASFSRQAKEMRLIYGSWDYNSLAYQAKDYAQYFPSQEIFMQEGVLPEINNNFRVNLRAELLRHSLIFETNYYNVVTENFITPILGSAGKFAPENVGTVRTRGIAFALRFTKKDFYHYAFVSIGDLEVESLLSVDFYRIKVKSLREGLPARVPLAGYSNLSTNMITGQPFGVIMGSSFLRNAEGKLIIDQNGFPKVSPQLQILGNPNPDAVLQWRNFARYKKASILLTFDYRIGGEIWNGTRSALNYWGRSKESADLRNTTGYVFEGVTEQGLPNQTPVSFANPNASVFDNRWVRYGVAGVGEEGIERATSLRLSNLELRYELSEWLSKRYIVSQTHLAIFAQNILLYAPYKGIDPATSLMGYDRAMGLDFFNIPNLVTWGMRLQMKI